MTQQRILRGAPGTLRATFADQDGTPVDAVGAVTVAVATADGTVVLAAGTATTHAGVGVYEVAVTAVQTAALGELAATWTDSGNGHAVSSTHAIVGGYYFSLADARASNDGMLADAGKYPDAVVLATRQEVEEEAEEEEVEVKPPRPRPTNLRGGLGDH